MKTDEKNKILFLSPFFFPEEISTGKYNTTLVNALKSRGCEVSVIASQPLYPDWKPKKTNMSLQGVKVFRGGLFIRYTRFQVLRRAILEIWYSYHVASKLVKYGKNYDMVIGVFPPVIYMLVASIFLPKKIVKVGIVHDLQGLMAKSNQNLKRIVVSKLIKFVEIIAFKKCDKLICLSDAMRSEIVNSYRMSTSVTSVFYPFVSIEERENKTSGLKEIFSSEHTHVVYSGALGEKQKPKELLQFLVKLCEAKSSVICHVFSRGPVFEELSESMASKDNNRILFHDLVPEELLVEMYERSTIHIIPQAEGTGAGAFPSKLPNLLSQGVPVFAICDKNSELNNVLKRVDFTKVVCGWNEAEMVESMLEFIDDVKGKARSGFRENFNEKIGAMFDVDTLADDLAKILKNVS